MNQTSENGKKPNFRPDFGLFGPNLDPKFSFAVLPLLLVGHCSKLSPYAI